MFSCGGDVEVDARLVMTTDPKPRLRWTAELHDRFVDAVTQLGGPDSEHSSPQTPISVDFVECPFAHLCALNVLLCL